MNLEQLEKENDMLRQALVKVNLKYEKLLVESKQLEIKANQRPKDLLQEIETLERENNELENKLDEIRSMTDY